MAERISTLVMFGATGDLARRMLLPSLYGLDSDGLLPDELESSELRAPRSMMRLFASAPTLRCKEHLPEGFYSAGIAERFLSRLHYVPVDITDQASFAKLAERIGDPCHGVGIFLSTAPSLFKPTIDGLAAAGLACPTVRLALEKPLGTDLESSREINDAVAAHFPEDRTFRIDHYLGKETVQNLIALRFANLMFEPLWNSAHIDHVQITVAETVGLEGRGDYYESSGALRDMVQNHMLQLLALVAMEPPSDFNATAVRDEKVKVLRALRPITAADVEATTVTGQYTRGAIDGEPVPGYAEEVGHESAHRDLRRLEGAYRQLALEGRAVLPAHRQADAAARHRDLHPVQGRALFDLRLARSDDAAEQADHRPAARREHRASADGEDAGARSRRASGCARSRSISASPTPSAKIGGASLTNGCCST